MQNMTKFYQFWENLFKANFIQLFYVDIFRREPLPAPAAPTAPGSTSTRRRKSAGSSSTAAAAAMTTTSPP
jgi:hypothetical protein